jgi:hypothetical protein
MYRISHDKFKDLGLIPNSFISWEINQNITVYAESSSNDSASLVDDKSISEKFFAPAIFSVFARFPHPFTQLASVSH